MLPKKAVLSVLIVYSPLIKIRDKNLFVELFWRRIVSVSFNICENYLYLPDVWNGLQSLLWEIDWNGMTPFRQNAIQHNWIQCVVKMCLIIRHCKISHCYNLYGNNWILLWLKLYVDFWHLSQMGIIWNNSVDNNTCYELKMGYKLVLSMLTLSHLVSEVKWRCLLTAENTCTCFHSTIIYGLHF